MCYHKQVGSIPSCFFVQKYQTSGMRIVFVYIKDPLLQYNESGTRFYCKQYRRMSRYGKRYGKTKVYQKADAEQASQKDPTCWRRS